MKLNDILKEAVDYSPNTDKRPEVTLPIYTKHKFDYGDRSNKITIGDIVLKASNNGNIYGRRKVAQRTLKMRK